MARRQQTLSRAARTARGVPSESIETEGLDAQTQAHIGAAVAALRKAAAGTNPPATLVEALDLLTRLPHHEG